MHAAHKKPPEEIAEGCDRISLDSWGTGLCLLVLVLLFGFLGAGLLGRADCLLMHDQTCPAFVLIPLKASEVGFLQLVVRLSGSVSG